MANSTTDTDSHLNCNKSLYTWLYNQPDPLFREVTEGWITFAIICFGLVGNVLAIIGLIAQKQPAVIKLILITLAVTDEILLCLTLVFRTLSWVDHRFPDYDHGHVRRAHDHWGYPLNYIVRMSEIWITTVLTIDRWIIVCKVMMAKQTLTIKVVVGQIVGVLVGVVLFNLPRCLEYKSPNFTATEIAKELHSHLAYKVVYEFACVAIFMYLIPVVTVTVLNTFLAKTLMKASTKRATMTHRPSRAAEEETKTLTKVVFVVVVIFQIVNYVGLVTHLLFYILQLEAVQAYVSCAVLNSWMCFYRRLSNVNVCLVVLNSSVNFLVYCFVSKYFRSALKNVFGISHVVSAVDKIRRRLSSHSFQRPSLDTEGTLIPLAPAPEKV